MIINDEIFKIMLRRKNMLLLDCLNVDSSNLPLAPEVLNFSDPKIRGIFLAATVGSDIEQLGYIFSESLFEEMVNDMELTKKVASDFVINSLKEIKGADVTYNPMYPNFPSQVIKMDDLQLYLNAFIHYISGGNLYLKTEIEPREKLNEKRKLSPLYKGTENDVKALLNNLLNSSSEWSIMDRTDIFEIIKVQTPDFNISLIKENETSNKENLAYLATMFNSLYGVNSFELFYDKITVPTDVLRIINVIHGNGDASLSEKVRLNNIPRSYRRVYLSMLNNCSFELAKKDMKNNYKLWVRIGEKLHPGEATHKSLYPMAYKLFSTMRDNEKLKTIQTIYSEIESAIANLKNNGSIDGIKKIKSVGIIARNLDRLVRSTSDVQQVLDFWRECAGKVSPEVLWSVYAHFQREMNNREEKYRIFISKGENSKTVIKEDTRKPIPLTICRQILEITFNAIQEIYKDKPAMNKVYIDPAVQKCKCPNNNRSGNFSNMSMAKGSKIPLPDNSNFIRGFIWWTNSKNGYRTDIDLSCSFFDEKFKKVSHLYYLNLKNKYAIHSGDITNGGDFSGKGVAEFLDINIEEAIKGGCRYAVFAVNSFTEENFSNIEHIKFGFMSREDADKGEIFEPSTVEQCVKLCSNSTSCVACAFDLVKREIVWIDDVAQNFINKSSINNVNKMSDGIAFSLYKAMNMEKPDIFDVICANVLARNGEIVGNPNEADIAFVLHKPTGESSTEFITPFDLDYFSGNLMPKEISKSLLKNKEEKKTKEYIPTEFELFLVNLLDFFS